MPNNFEEKSLEEMLSLYIRDLKGGNITDKEVEIEVQRLINSCAFLVQGYVIHSADSELFYKPIDRETNQSLFVPMHEFCKVFEAKEEAIGVASALDPVVYGDLIVARKVASIEKSIFFPIWTSMDNAD